MCDIVKVAPCCGWYQNVLPFKAESYPLCVSALLSIHRSAHQCYQRLAVVNSTAVKSLHGKRLGTVPSQTSKGHPDHTVVLTVPVGGTKTGKMRDPKKTARTVLETGRELVSASSPRPTHIPGHRCLFLVPFVLPEAGGATGLVKPHCTPVAGRGQFWAEESGEAAGWGTGGREGMKQKMKPPTPP